MGRAEGPKDLGSVLLEFTKFTMEFYEAPDGCVEHRHGSGLDSGTGSSQRATGRCHRSPLTESVGETWPNVAVDVVYMTKYI